MGSAGYCDCLKKAIFSKNASFKGMSQFTYCDISTKAYNKLNSIYKKMIQCKRQQATFSFKPIFLHLSCTPAQYMLCDHT